MSAHLIDPAELLSGWAGEWRPIGLVDLGSVDGGISALDLPPFPVVGIGNPAHPLASVLDALVESPVTTEMLVSAIEARPCTAAVAVQLLRNLDAMDVAAGLVHESMAYGLLQGGGEHADWLAARAVAPPMPEGRVHVTREGERLDIVLDRPQARNAIDRPMRDALREAFTLVALDPDLRTVTLRGLGRAFCVGADLDEFGTTRDPLAAHMIRMRTLPAHAIARAADRLEVHVEGACVGAGLEMAAFARRLTCAANAWFQLPELAMGVIPGAGGCVSVARRIGRQRAALMILSGRRISAATALAWGLVDAIVDQPPAGNGAADVEG